MPDAVMIFAAGRGTRMAPLTDTVPKPLIKVAGKALLDHALALTDRTPVTRRVVNTHYLASQIKAHLAQRPDIQLSDEDDALLETGGGLRKALPLLGPGPVFTLNSDAVWSDASALEQLRAAWDPTRMDALLLLVPPGRAHGHTGAGDFSIASNGQITRGGPAIYTGAQIANPAGLHHIHDDAFSLNRLWNRHAQAGRLFGTLYAGDWTDVGTPAGIHIAEQMLGVAS